MSHPAHYPVQVLWTLTDCQSDQDVGVLCSNWSHPPMRLSVCTKDSSMITDAEWKSICKAAALITCTCLECLDPSGCLDPGQPCKKKFFKCHFSTEWNATLLELEGMCPLLSLCASAGCWKANTILGMVLSNLPNVPPLSPSPQLFHIVQCLIQMFPPLPLWLPLHAVLLSNVGPFAHAVSVCPR
jgi:hypothetical protein